MADVETGMRGHWDAIYRTKGPARVSWFEAEPVVSLDLIDGLKLGPDDPIADVGGGASRLVDRLLDRGQRSITVVDVATEAIRIAQERLAARSADVEWETSDVLEWEPGRTFRLWHDRAVFHFLTDAEQRRAYAALAARSVEPGGHLIIATFAEDGPEMCSNLPVMRYTAAELAAQFSAEFREVERRRSDHLTPFETHQPFTWVVLRRDG